MNKSDFIKRPAKEVSENGATREDIKADFKEMHKIMRHQWELFIPGLTKEDAALFFEMKVSALNGEHTLEAEFYVPDSIDAMNRIHGTTAQGYTGSAYFFKSDGKPLMGIDFEVVKSSLSILLPFKSSNTSVSDDPLTLLLALDLAGPPSLKVASDE